MFFLTPVLDNHVMTKINPSQGKEIFLTQLHLLGSVVYLLMARDGAQYLINPSLRHCLIHHGSFQRCFTLAGKGGVQVLGS
jgi:hypothetical protein